VSDVSTSEQLVVSHGQGRSVWLGGLGVDFKVTGERTGGSFAVVEHPIEAGRLVPPHLHHDEDECSLIVEGRIGARIGDAIVDAGPGDYVWKPRGVPHTFWNPGPEPARLVEIITPARFEGFFAELGALAAQGLPVEEFTARRAQLGARYHQDFVDGWAEELMATYGLRLLGQ
jgi:mannose-6-phosphate isomerase-like protein (cupin superfamily)